MYFIGIIIFFCFFYIYMIYVNFCLFEVGGGGGRGEGLEAFLGEEDSHSHRQGGQGLEVQGSKVGGAFLC